MIANDRELHVTFERISRSQEQVARLRQVEANPSNYYAAESGVLAEIDRMQREIREYLSPHLTELETGSSHIARTTGSGRLCLTNYCSRCPTTSAALPLPAVEEAGEGYGARPPPSQPSTAREKGA